MNADVCMSAQRWMWMRLCMNEWATCGQRSVRMCVNMWMLHGFYMCLQKCACVCVCAMSGSEEESTFYILWSSFYTLAHIHTVCGVRYSTSKKDSKGKNSSPQNCWVRMTLCASFEGKNRDRNILTVCYWETHIWRLNISSKRRQVWEECWGKWLRVALAACVQKSKACKRFQPPIAKTVQVKKGQSHQ
jgi:hypothetical protein